MPHTKINAPSRKELVDVLHDIENDKVLVASYAMVYMTIDGVVAYAHDYDNNVEMLGLIELLQAYVLQDVLDRFAQQEENED